LRHFAAQPLSTKTLGKPELDFYIGFLFRGEPKKLFGISNLPSFRFKSFSLIARHRHNPAISFLIAQSPIVEWFESSC